eukprot:COSAG03_NODE_2231_length_2976_cov_1.947515_4_plen_86_part_00
MIRKRLRGPGGHDDVVRLLGSKSAADGADADLEMEDKAGQSPLAAAAHHGKRSTARLLQALGAISHNNWHQAFNDVLFCTGSVLR